LTALEIYSAAMDWCDDQPTMGYTVPMKAIGKAPLGGGVYTDSIFILQNGWKIKFWSGTYQAVITGTLITDDETSRTVPPDSGNIEVIFQVSSQATVIPDEAEWTQTEKETALSDLDAIEAKTGNLPPQPASESTVQSVKTKTEALPVDPAQEASVQFVGEALAIHDSDVRGNPTDEKATLKTLKGLIEELAAQEAIVEDKPRSVAQALEKKNRS